MARLYIPEITSYEPAILFLRLAASQKISVRRTSEKSRGDWAASIATRARIYETRAHLTVYKLHAPYAAKQHETRVTKLERNREDTASR